MSHIAITIPATETLREVLIAQLASAGFEGFEETEDSLVAFVPLEQFNELELQEILNGHGLAYTQSTIAPANWNAIWESSFEPVLVDDFCGIRAGFHAPVHEVVQHEIVITPKMSFGTGHHATTYSMIQLMRDIDFSGKRVFDFGTGTGILAILADKMGAVQTDAIDIDPGAVENALENIQSNGARNISAWQADNLRTLETGSYDVILANINRNILLEAIQEMKRVLKSDGLLILSGILQEDESAILVAAASENLHLVRKAARSNWLAISFEKD